MIKRMLIMLIVVGLVLGGVFGFIIFKGRMVKQFMTAQAQPPQTVSTITAQYQDWLPKLETVGTVRAVQGVDISAEVAGLVTDILFRQGETVAVNTPLLKLRADDDAARLKALQANAELAQITLRRSEAQWAAKAISQQTLDIDRANLNVALANVAAQQALLDKKTIRAPFTGVVGLRNVDVGQYLEVGKAITSLQQLATMYVDFALPQQHLAELKPGQAVEIISDAYPNQVFAGKLTTINPRVDTATRNVQIRASLNNPSQQLLPGMFAQVRVITGAAQPLITLPRTAISFNPVGASVFIVEAQGKNAQGQAPLVARQAFVTPGTARGDQISILKGVNDGEQVVTSGQIKLHHGTVVTVDNSAPPSNDAAPQPIDQ